MQDRLNARADAVQQMMSERSVFFPPDSADDNSEQKRSARDTTSGSVVVAGNALGRVTVNLRWGAEGSEIVEVK